MFVTFNVNIEPDGY